MSTISKSNPCPKCGYPMGVGCDLCCKSLESIGDLNKKKRGPEPRPDEHKGEVIRVPLCLHPKVKEMVAEWKRENGYV